ncbi:MAG: hypothetical protein IJX76_04540 [Clostridia bacterium]|nr:hypothetical protein [Clostridia bacterium]
MKKALSFILSALLLVSVFSIASFAAENEASVQPRWINTASIDCIFEFENTKIGYAEMTVVGHIGTDKITGNIQIYRQNGSSWVLVEEDTITKESRSFSMGVETTGVSGAYYKSVFTMTVYKDDVPKVITRTSYATCP